MIRFLLLTFISLTLIACSKPEENSKPNLKLSFNEVLLPIPEDLTNDWFNTWPLIDDNGQRSLLIYDPYQKNFAKYSLSEKKVIDRLRPFSDTLDPRNISVSIRKIESGYFLNSAYLGFLYLDNNGELLKRWDAYIPDKNPIPNYNYDLKYRLNTSRSELLTRTGSTSTPLAIVLTNIYMEAIYKEDFYITDILANFNFATGEFKRFPIRYPDHFNQNGKTYPKNSLFAYVGLEDNRIAYCFGIDEDIHVLDVETGEVEVHSIVNPDLPLKIYPIDEAAYKGKEFFNYEYLANYTVYSNLSYHPDMDLLLRMALRVENNIVHKIFEIINSDYQIIGQFEIPEPYSVNPVFFPTEIWFPYLMGYKPDEMKYYRVTIEE